MTSPGIVSAVSLAVLALAIVIAWAAKQTEALVLLLGVAGSNATTVVNYWLGSSAGSRAKDEIIARNGS